MKNSKIEWTHHTFDPWWGCDRVSPACKHCYAETFSHRFGMELWGKKSERRFLSDSYWRQPCARKAEAELLELRYEIAEHETRGKKVMPVHAFSAMDRPTLERFTIDLVAHWEQRFREGVKWRHDQFASSRKWALEKAEEARRREAERLAAQVRALIQGRQRLLHRALDGIRRSDQIRSLVMSLQASKAGMADEQDSIDRWAVWACQQADLLDPRLMSAEQATKWAGEFRLEQG